MVLILVTAKNQDKDVRHDNEDTMLCLLLVSVNDWISPSYNEVLSKIEHVDHALSNHLRTDDARPPVALCVLALHSSYGYRLLLWTLDCEIV
jgi:hypothetical protein